jgi:hypothetical protein
VKARFYQEKLNFRQLFNNALLLLRKKGKQAEPGGYPFNKQKSKIQNSKLFVD